MNIIRIQGPKEVQAGIYYEYDSDSTPLGEGGMGRVFKGFRVNQRTGERTPVAIKAIYENIPERVVERARREASIQVDSDNLIRMFGFVETPVHTVGNGKPRMHYHVIMELLVGVTLEDLLNGVTTDRHGVLIPFASEIREQYQNDRVNAVVRIMKAVLAGLMSLHDRGYIHRDIDPSNIMLTADRKIKLIDFGICKQIVSLESVDKCLTSAGVFMGKVNYAAPELVLGDVKSQTYATDIYALGVLLYRLTAGHLPFSGTDQDILAANLRKKFPMGDVKRSDLRAIIQKASEKNRNKRYASVAEMRVALEHVDTSKTEVPWLRIAVIAGVVAAMAVAVSFLLNDSGKDEPDHALDSTATVVDNPAAAPVANAVDLFSDAMADIATNQPERMSAGQLTIRTLAADSAYVPAMLELATLYVSPTSAFPEIAERQKNLGIKPDLDLSDAWLEKVLEKEPMNYKAAYWLYNNLMVKFDNDDITPDQTSRLVQAFDLFKSLVEASAEPEAAAYSKAMQSADDEKTLRNWALI